MFNLGCKLNQYEGYCLQKKFAAQHDVIIINTCCVTAEAAHKSRKKFHRALRLHPHHKVIATGCACTLHPEEYTGAYQVINTDERNQCIANVYPEPPRSRYFLKIQDGCTEGCTYCIVPVIRHRLLSVAIDRILEEIAWARMQGFNEIVLVGANVGLYGAEIRNSLVRLLHELSNVKALPRVRLSSIEPRFIGNDLIEALQCLPLCRHFHIPIQSGDDSVLARMGRICTNHDLRERIGALARAFPDAAIGCDVIVGFPGEEQEHFAGTEDLLRDLPFTHAHIFPYSSRPGTRACAYGDPVPSCVKKDRLWALKSLVAQKNMQFRKRLVGKTFDVLVIRSAPGCTGLTDNYVRVELDRPFAKGMLVRVRIDRVEGLNTYGSAIERKA